MATASDTARPTTRTLSLSVLDEGTPGITPAFGASLAEAASVCLEDQKHAPGTPLRVDGGFRDTFSLFWNPATDQMRRCWADPEVATEHGAYAVATLLFASLTELTVTARSRKGTGFDYWLGPKSNRGLLFQNKARLEVSGIRNGTDSAVEARVRQKLEQTKPTDTLLPAYVVVVEFSAPRSKVIEKCRT